MTITTATRPLRVFVAGLGQMGRSHALAYHTNPAFEIVGLYNRTEVDLPAALAGYPQLASYEDGLALKPDVVDAISAVRRTKGFVELALAQTLKRACVVRDHLRAQ